MVLIVPGIEAKIKVKESGKNSNYIMNFISTIFSIDYTFSKLSKLSIADIANDNELEKRKFKTVYIKIKNSWNLYISLLLIILLILIDRFSVSEEMMKFISVLLFVRIIARLIEITVAFYMDIIKKNEKKSTELSAEDRIKLAVKSLVEIIITCGSMYILLQYLDNFNVGGKD